ncbi:hypothetical protein MSAN_02283900 [Mycena sanguinolenta]|uniref:Uncharacterized protein n=1 Tax=Mycena sanguinolenta TaxID=230812 RepID=A0A8H7CG85_9AGAR|nr:hypothetical protein MSAN_02283900 [Mycena sanguinolenta]
MDPLPDHNTPDLTTANGEVQTFPDRPLKDYLVGPKTSHPVVHGWTRESILYNHLDENVTKVLKKPLTSVAAVIITRDRPSDRAAGADAITDALHDLKVANKDDFIVIPPTPKVGDPNAPILPHTNIIMCSSTDLKDKVTDDPSKAVVHTTRKDGTDGFSFYLLPAACPELSWHIGTYVGMSNHTTPFEFFSGLFDRLISDRAVIKMIQEHHDRVPEAQDIPFVVRVILEYAEIKPCQVWMPGKQGRAPERQNAMRLYMPTPSLDAAASKEFKDHLTAPTFSFLIDCRGRATPFQPSRGGRVRAMECSECLRTRPLQRRTALLLTPPSSLASTSMTLSWKPPRSAPPSPPSAITTTRQMGSLLSAVLVIKESAAFAEAAPVAADKLVVASSS